jgi:hypothetical protein
MNTEQNRVAGERGAGRVASQPGSQGFAPEPLCVSAKGADPSRESGGRFAEWDTATLAAQARMQAREQLDPEYTQFMFALADRLAGFAASKRDGNPAHDWQLAYAIEWANRSVESVKARMWSYEDALRFYADPSSWTDGDVPMHIYAIDDAGYTARQALRDSDEHPKGEDAERLSGGAMPARAEGIAQ